MKKINYLVITILFFVTSQNLFGQISLSNYPTNHTNTRFSGEERFIDFRPALTIRGFDSSTLPDNGDYGYGLKQILEKVYNSPVDQGMKDIYEDILIISNRTWNSSPTSRSQYESNAKIIEALAFESLVSYILKKTNSASTYTTIKANTSPNLREFSTVFSEFRTRVLSFDDYLFDRDAETDGVKYPANVARLARALDLYLALENAVKKYDLTQWNSSSSTSLLTQTQRTSVFRKFEDFVKEAHTWATNIPVNNAWLNFGAGGIFAPDQVQAGNWPLKAHSAIGFFALGSHDRFSGVDSLFDDYDEYVEKALIGSSTYVLGRDFYWNYQTNHNVSNGGNNYWAEGPFYFEYTLREVVPFWHALRGTDNLSTGFNNYTSGLGYDPFFDQNFTKPLNWLADLVTPDGRTPAIDDGKKQKIGVSGILGWNSDYGSSSTGQKFKFVNSRAASNESLLIMELAIPKSSSSSNPANLYGNEQASVTESNWKNVQIARSSNAGSTTDHSFILLNGEIGQSIFGGEGHDQPDQLQLLFYHGTESFLMDSGYDFGSPTDNDVRGRYWYNNTMALNDGDKETNLFGFTTYENYGGLENPKFFQIGLFPFIFEAGKEARQPDVENFYLTRINGEEKAVLLKGEIELSFKDGMNVQNGDDKVSADYSRNVLVINDDQGVIDYIIDFNTLDHKSGGWHDYIMRYHMPKSHPLQSSTNTIISPTFNGDLDPNGWYTLTTPSQSFYFFTKAIENKSNVSIAEPGILFEEYESTQRSAFQLELSNSNTTNFNTIGIFTPHSNQTNNTPERQFAYYSNDQTPYQAWVYKQDANTIDYIFMRSKLDASFASQDIDVDIVSSGNLLASVKIDKNNAFAFTRLKKTNGLWLIDQDYTINLSQTGDIYSSDETVGSYTYPSGGRVYVGNNVTVTYNGIMNFNSTEVYLGQGAKIEVRNGGRLITDGAHFKRLDASDQHYGIKLYTSGNIIENSTIEGAYTGIYMYNSDNNTIVNSKFLNNRYGLYTWYSDDLFISKSTFENNSGSGLWALYSTIDVEPNTSGSTQSRTYFQGNGAGIGSSLGSNINVRNTTFNGNSGHDFYVFSSARLYLSNGNIDDGNNIFLSPPSSPSDASPRKYIWSTALTGSGEMATQWTIPARKNYWYGGNAPVWHNFYGSVDYSNHLTSMPSNSSNMMAFKSVESAITGQSKINQGFSKVQLDNSIRFKELIYELQEKIEDPENEYQIGKLLKSYSGMLDVVDKELLEEEINYLRAKENNWLAKYQFIYDIPISDSLAGYITEEEKALLRWTSEDLEFIHRANTAQTVGEVMLALQMKRAVEADNYQRVFDLVLEYNGRVSGLDLKYELISYLLIASITAERYQLALQLIERLEAMEPMEELLLEQWEPEDFTILKNDLKSFKGKDVNFKDDAKLASVFESTIDLGLEELADDMVSEFKLYPAYPNPFNPSTNITFDLPEQGRVRVEVFDIGGRLVSILANQDYQQGNHRLTFDASGLASGVYLIRANIAGNIQTQQITLIK